MSDEISVAPNIIVPDKHFLIGAIYGFNAARKRLEQNPQPLMTQEDNSIQEATNKDFYLGSWLEITCAKCGFLYTFDNPNQLPDQNMKCTNKECDNYLIFYGIVDPTLWRIGQITFI